MPGQIIPRGDRTWLVRIFLGRDPQTGKRVYDAHTVHGNKKDAERYLRGVLLQKDMGVYAGVQHTTMSALFDELLRDYKINGKDYDWAERVVRVHLRPQFGAMKAAKVTSEQIENYISGRQDAGAANATINRALALLRRAFQLGRKATPPKVGVIPFIRKLAENNVRKGFFEHNQFTAVRAALSEELRPVITFAYYTGCRKGEILMLQWSQVDLAERVVRLEPGETKNDEAREIPLAPDLYLMLQLQKELRDRLWPDSLWVFSRCGEQIRNFRKAWDTACKKAGLITRVDDEEKANKLFHDLRRTGVRNLVRAGVPERVAMMISGHKTRSVFDRYNIVNTADLKDAAKRLGVYLADKSAPSGNRHTIGTQEASKDVQ